MPEKKPPLDVAIVGPPTEDGQGRRVIRIRDDGASVGEVRPVPEGKPILPSAEVVALTPREGAPGHVRDVKVLHAPTAPAPTAHKGPPKVASDAYRAGWDRLFGAKPNGDETLNLGRAVVG